MDELCNLLMFLQADGCDYITGQNIAIDGGHHLASPSTFAELGAVDAAGLGRCEADRACEGGAGEGAAQHRLSGVGSEVKSRASRLTMTA